MLLIDADLDAAILDLRLPDPKELGPTIPVLLLARLPLSNDQDRLAPTLTATVFYEPQPFEPLIDFLVNGDVPVR